MSDAKQFKLPDVGEGLTEAEIVTWRVKPGDSVKVNDIIVEIETAKSLVELPVPWAGTVTELLVNEGETVAVGTPIIAVSPSGAAPAGEGEGAAVSSPPAEGAVEPGVEGSPAPGERQPTLVGPGPRATTGKRRPRKPQTSVPQGASAAAAQTGVQSAFQPHTTPAPQADVEQAEQEAESVAEPAPEPGAAPPAPAARGDSNVRVLAKPPVRKLAKDLGVDLTTVAGSGEGGIVTRADVEAHAGGGAAAAPAPVQPPAAMLRGERETRVPIKGVRKMTAQAMVSSAFTAPHVTEWVTVDATRTMRFVERLRGHRDFRDVRVSPLLVVARAVCLAVRRTPEVNATWDDAAQEIVLKHYVNLGIAAATPRGLVVPNVKDADQMSMRKLAGALGELTATAREGKTPPGDMQGGSFTITNVGVFGVDGGTPIINPGESAILCMGAIRKQPWVVGNRVKPRWVTQLALSFDHRMVDGQQGSQFLADVAALVEDPANALLH
jgi:2-oxoisovalerate dehydrogenase E2 component (dihydrolipoyl transacylase)